MERAHTQVAPPQIADDSELPLLDLDSCHIGDTAPAHASPVSDGPSQLSEAEPGAMKAAPVAARAANASYKRTGAHPSLQLCLASAAAAPSAISGKAVPLHASGRTAGHARSASSHPSSDDEEDSYGTRIPLSSVVSLALSTPSELLARAEHEMDMLAQLAASPAHQARQFTEAASMPALMQKNRYSNIIPTRAARVVLKSASGDMVDSYINACLMPPLLPGCTQSYLAAQAPLPNTLADFWCMVWEQETELVVMLTKERERDVRGNVSHKAHAYWPEVPPAQAAGAAGSATGAAASGDDLPSARFGDFTVTLLSARVESDIVVRELLLQRTGSEDPPRVVHQLQYTGWPDFGVPDDTDESASFVRMFSIYRNLRTRLQQQKTEQAGNADVVAAASSAASASAAAAASSAPAPAPIVVHCSAGVGRSGVWIAIDALLDCVGSSRPPVPFVDVFSLTLRMREARQGMLQTKQQYAYVVHFLATCMKKGMYGLKDVAQQ